MNVNVLCVGGGRPLALFVFFNALVVLPNTLPGATML